MATGGDRTVVDDEQVTVADLADCFHVMAVSLRRDLKLLEDGARLLRASAMVPSRRERPRRNGNLPDTHGSCGRYAPRGGRPLGGREDPADGGRIEVLVNDVAVQGGT